MSLLPSGLASSGSQEEGTRLTWTGGNTTGEGERERNITIGHICMLEEGEWKTKRSTTASTQRGLRLNVVLPSPSSTVTVVIDGYTHNSILTSGDSVPLGTQLILVCWVVGLPYGTPLSYTWRCRNGQICNTQGSYARRFHNKHTLAVNTTATFDDKTYTCQVTATGGQGATGSFSLSVTGTCVCLVLYYSSNGAGTSLVLHTHSGGRVVHSKDRLIPHQFPITHLQQISYQKMHGSETVTKHTVTCVSSGTPPPRFYSLQRTPNIGGVSKWTNIRPIDVDTNTFQNRDVYCDDRDTNYFYLYLTSSNNSELTSYHFIVWMGSSPVTQRSLHITRAK